MAAPKRIRCIKCNEWTDSAKPHPTLAGFFLCPNCNASLEG